MWFTELDLQLVLLAAQKSCGVQDDMGAHQNDYGEIQRVKLKVRGTTQSKFRSSAPKLNLASGGDYLRPL